MVEKVERVKHCNWPGELCIFDGRTLRNGVNHHVLCVLERAEHEVERLQAENRTLRFMVRHGPALPMLRAGDDEDAWFVSAMQEAEDRRLTNESLLSRSTPTRHTHSGANWCVDPDCPSHSARTAREPSSETSVGSDNAGGYHPGDDSTESRAVPLLPRTKIPNPPSTPEPGSPGG